MRISIRLSAGCAAPRSELLRKRLEFALGRFSSHVRTLSVRLKDLNGPRGGLDKHCQIVVGLGRPRRVIVVEDVDSELETAISRAAARAARAVSRAVQSAADRRLLSGAAPHWR